MIHKKKNVTVFWDEMDTLALYWKEIGIGKTVGQAGGVYLVSRSMPIGIIGCEIKKEVVRVLESADN